MTNIKIVALVDNVVYSDYPILSESAISLFIEVECEDKFTRILFDAGFTGEPLIRNANLLGVNLHQVDFVIISHNHYDHIGGLLEVLKKIGRKISVVMHPEVFEPKYMIIPNSGIHNLTYTGPSFTIKDIVDAGGIPILSRNPVLLAPNVMTTGEVERVTEFEKIEGFYMVRNSEFVKDELMDDQALTVKIDDENIVVFTGCAHSGVINSVHYALKLAKAKKVRAIIGGFHLMDASEERIRKTVQMLRNINPEIVAPMHCTGFKASMNIAKDLPQAFKEFHCGNTMKLTSAPT
jgi:7,8-dihydropterin-6-yl-methyl-4-(beta-D-ribofuranosyl)aminobenzene 5'-phosphate synthase